MIPPFDIFKWKAAAFAGWKRRLTWNALKRECESSSASSPGEYIILNQITGEKITIQPKSKRIVFQIGYEERGMKARAELLRRFGHEVISVTHNEAAKVALSSYHDVELFIVGHTAPEQTRKEMVAWLKANYLK